MENGSSAVERLSVNRRSQESNPLVHSAAEMSRPYLARWSAGILLREVFEAWLKSSQVTRVGLGIHMSR